MSGRVVLVPGLLMLAVAGCGQSPENAAARDTAPPQSAAAFMATPDAPVANEAQGAQVALTSPAAPVPTAPTARLPLVASNLPVPQRAANAAMDLPPSGNAISAQPFPREVTAFMVDRDGCDHFRGEDAYDADRRAYIEDNIAQLCTGTDARLARLRLRYASDPDVIAALKSYDSDVEDGPQD